MSDLWKRNGSGSGQSNWHERRRRRSPSRQTPTNQSGKGFGTFWSNTNNNNPTNGPVGLQGTTHHRGIKNKSLTTSHVPPVHQAGDLIKASPKRTSPLLALVRPVLQDASPATQALSLTLTHCIFISFNSEGTMLASP